MTEQKQWKRPQDVVTFRTKDPKEMLGKYLPKHALVTEKRNIFTNPNAAEKDSVR